MTVRLFAAKPDEELLGVCLLLHGPLQIKSLVGVEYVGKRDPAPQIRHCVDGRICQNWPPKKHVQVRRDLPDPPFTQPFFPACWRPFASAPEKKSPNCTESTKTTTGMMLPRRPVKSRSKSTGS